MEKYKDLSYVHLLIGFQNLSDEGQFETEKFSRP